MAVLAAFIAIRQKEAQFFEKFAEALCSGAVDFQFGGDMGVCLRNQIVSGI